MKSVYEDQSIGAELTKMTSTASPGVLCCRPRFNYERMRGLRLAFYGLLPALKKIPYQQAIWHAP